MDQDSGKEKKPASHETDNKREFEIAANPNPRANENIRERPEDPGKGNINTNTVGSEITDGEAG